MTYVFVPFCCYKFNVYCPERDDDFTQPAGHISEQRKFFTFGGFDQLKGGPNRWLICAK